MDACGDFDRAYHDKVMHPSTATLGGTNVITASDGWDTDTANYTWHLGPGRVYSFGHHT